MEIQDRIDKYLLGRMTVREREEFEQQMASDKDLADQVELERTIAEGIFAANLKAEMQTFAQEKEVNRPGARILPLKNMRWLAVAASVAILAVFFWQNNSGSTQIFDDYYAADPGLPVTMGQADDKQFAEAMIAYKESEWDRAQKGFSELCLLDVSEACFYLAQTQIQNLDYSSARKTLESILSSTASISSKNKAEWHLAYVLYQLKDPGYSDYIQKIASSPQHPFHKRAQEILHKM